MTQWLRVWHDLPNDPKFRTIARLSKQPLAVVQAVYLHLLVDASANATERGRTRPNASEDIASALDLETADVEQIVEAMQGRLLDGLAITGWAKRQPLREDGSAERSKAWREGQKLRKAAEAERNRTQANAEKRPDTDTDTERTPPTAQAQARDSSDPNNTQAPLDPLTPHLMSIDWVPDPDVLAPYAKRAGLPPEKLEGQVLATFVLHHEPAGLAKSEQEWCADFVRWAIKQARWDENDFNRRNGSGRGGGGPANGERWEPDDTATDWLMQRH